MDVRAADEAYQDQILPHVSRTFALTIPQLPPSLRVAVTNAYLLCRVADTIEDQTGASSAARLGLLHRFVAVLRGREAAEELTRDLMPRLSEHTLPAERELLLNTARIVRLTAALDASQRLAIERCVEVMCDGMHRFQRTASLDGLACLSDLDDYCYYVAGVVGEMLTELFCAYSPAIEARRSELEALSVSFAEGLQMTNILKDVWEDRARGACWLPREVFTPRGVELRQLRPDAQPAGFHAGITELVGVAHAHLRNALSYALLMPEREVGIRRFCLWAIGLAILTLRRIVRTPGYSTGTQVKLSHAAVGATQLLSNAAIGHNWLLQRLFALAARGVPRAQLAALPAHTRAAHEDLRTLADSSHAALHATQADLQRNRSFGP
jgi:farnesyl-diphosphate farnesyltransferase